MQHPNPFLQPDRPPEHRRLGPILFGLGVLSVFVLGLVLLLTMDEPDEVDDAELTELLNNPETEDSIPPYYYETQVVQGASIQINSSPAGAFATLDAETVGLTPLGLSTLEPGYYEIRVDHPDHFPLDTTLYLASGAVYQLDVVLQPRVEQDEVTIAEGPAPSPPASSQPAAPQRDRIQRAGRPAPGGVSAPSSAPAPATSFARADPETIRRVYTTGSLSVTSEPAGARVVVDGQPRGTTPLSVTGLRPGAHEVRLTLPGRSALDYTAPVAAGAVYQIDARFEDGD